MGTLGTILHNVFYRWVMWYNRLRAWFVSTKQLHIARFARIDELHSLQNSTLTTETSLLLGISRFNHILRVQPQPTRRELGNVLIVNRASHN